MKYIKKIVSWYRENFFTIQETSTGKALARLCITEMNKAKQGYDLRYFSNEERKVYYEVLVTARSKYRLFPTCFKKRGHRFLAAISTRTLLRMYRESLELKKEYADFFYPMTDEGLCYELYFEAMNKEIDEITDENRCLLKSSVFSCPYQNPCYTVRDIANDSVISETFSARSL